MPRRVDDGLGRGPAHEEGATRMTDTERRQLADIERMLRTESPDLAKLLSGTSGPGSGTGRTCWWIGGPVAIVSLALLSLGAALGQAGLAIFAIALPPPSRYSRCGNDAGRAGYGRAPL